MDWKVASWMPGSFARWVSQQSPVGYTLSFGTQYGLSTAILFLLRDAYISSMLFALYRSLVNNL